jgi:hypothetical protein
MFGAFYLRNFLQNHLRNKQLAVFKNTFFRFVPEKVHKWFRIRWYTSILHLAIVAHGYELSKKTID